MTWSNVYDGKSVESGKCPHCKSMGGLEYGSMECLDGELVYYPFRCDECGCKGREHNQIRFDGMEITERPKESVDFDNLTKEDK